MSTEQTENQLNRIAYDAVEHAIWIPVDADEKLQRAKSSNSLLRYLYNEISKSAVRVGVARKVDPDDFENELLPEAIQIVQSIYWVFVREPYKGDIKANWNFWRHQDFALQRIKKKDVPYIGRSDLEDAATQYLNSPFRAQAVDRILIDGLMALEIFAFGDEMINPYFQSPLTRRHVLWRYIKGQFWGLVVAGSLIALFAWLNHKDILGETGVLWSVGIVLLLAALQFVIASIALPVAWLQEGKEKAHTLLLLSGMLGVYSDLKSDGAISAQHVMERAKAVAAQGVAWPAPLFAMLDDVLRRSGRF